ncbi:cyclin-dependent kinase inhibitor 1-like [Phragmites australis]|uniref:cyclin-dependent kinase inhibitor 1-like n=1 Tax=Phragmites australis TaxID=29695 RepID=UPI002D76555F|nr:cyclin-dependent kinase inhibitor 1-like [Phragmites australis]
MGKYVRKCRGAGVMSRAPAAVELAQVVVGVRTRARSAAFASEVAVRAPKRPRKAAARAEVGVETGRDSGGAVAGCYLQLRSRRLFMAAAEVVAPRRAVAEAGEEEEEASSALQPAGSRASEEALVAGVSRCSSTASSVNVVVARDRSGGVAEAREDRGVESSVSDSGREATPSSCSPGDLSDQESSEAADDPKHHRRRRATATTAVACRARTPPADEIEEFFAAAEKAEAERFAAKYNFDVVRGAPLDVGRFKWTPVASG